MSVIVIGQKLYLKIVEIFIFLLFGLVLVSAVALADQKTWTTNKDWNMGEMIGVKVIGSGEPASVVLINQAGTGAISGKVTIQNCITHSALITFELREPGKSIPMETYQITTSTDDTYALSGISPGTYDLTAKSFNTLRAKNEDIVVGEGETISDIDFSLLEGDCDGNNVVNAFDNSILNAALGSQPGDSNWDPRADLDGNNIVNAFDNSILNGNFGKYGAE